MKKNILSGFGTSPQLPALNNYQQLQICLVSSGKGVGCAKMYTSLHLDFFCVCVGAPQPVIITVSIEGGQITAYKMYCIP